MKLPGYAKKAGLILIAAAVLFLQWHIKERREELRGRELVQTLELKGHRYDLYFHRRADYFNTIRKDGVVVFDGREDPELQPCIQEIVVVDEVVHRRCYLSQRRQVILVALP